MSTEDFEGDWWKDEAKVQKARRLVVDMSKELLSLGDRIECCKVKGYGDSLLELRPRWRELDRELHRLNAGISSFHLLGSFCRSVKMKRVRRKGFGRRFLDCLRGGT